MNTAWVKIVRFKCNILGPLLFLIFMDDIVQTVRNPIYLFADDASLMKIFDNINEAETSMNHDLTAVRMGSFMASYTVDLTL